MLELQTVRVVVSYSDNTYFYNKDVLMHLIVFLQSDFNLNLFFNLQSKDVYFKNPCLVFLCKAKASNVI